MCVAYEELGETLRMNFGVGLTIKVTFDRELTQRLSFQVKAPNQCLSILASWFSDLKHV